MDTDIAINRGSRGTIKLINSKGKFKVGDKFRFSIVEKNDYDNVIFQKEYTVTEESNVAYITLTKEDTTIGDVISKQKQYNYEIKYNDDVTLLGYNDDGGKIFILYPNAGTKRSV